MSTSLLYHAFGARSYRHLRAEYVGGTIRFHMEKKPEHQRCSVCGSRDVVREGHREREVRGLPIGSRPVFLVLHLSVLTCRECRTRGQESLDVAEPRKSYTKRLAKLVLDLSRRMTLSDIAEVLSLGWDLVKGIVKEHLRHRSKRRSWRHVRYVAIDEFAVRKGHQYMTVVMDLDTGEVLYVAEGKDYLCLEPFFRRIRHAHAKLLAIAVDMWPGYRKAIERFGPPGVQVIHDRYHIVSDMNGVIDAVRRQEQNRLEGAAKRVIKGSRYLLLHGQEKLSLDPKRRSRLQELLECNELLHKVYLLKEDLRLFWDQPDRETAKEFILRWVQEARALGCRPVSRIAEAVITRIDCVLAWYDHPISTAPLEGLNNKIKVLKRMAYGFRDMEFFKLRVLFIHESQSKLSGV
jgi:transposase